MQQRTLLFIQLEIDMIKRSIAEEEQFIKAEEEFIPFSIAHNMPTEPTEKLIETMKATLARYEKKLSKAEAEEKAFMDKLNGIDDPEVKEMAKAYFIDLESCEAIGKRHFLERTTVYKKIQRYFEA